MNVPGQKAEKIVLSGLPFERGRDGDEEHVVLEGLEMCTMVKSVFESNGESEE